MYLAPHDLKNPGIGPRGEALRRACSNLTSYIERPLPAALVTAIGVETGSNATGELPAWPVSGEGGAISQQAHSWNKVRESWRKCFFAQTDMTAPKAFLADWAARLPQASARPRSRSAA